MSPNSSGTPAATTGPVASTSTGEREKIRDFWLGLNEKERRSLVRVEKEAVLRKMKEQQRACALNYASTD